MVALDNLLLLLKRTMTGSLLGAFHDPAVQPESMQQLLLVGIADGHVISLIWAILKA